MGDLAGAARRQAGTAAATAPALYIALVRLSLPGILLCGLLLAPLGSARAANPLRPNLRGEVMILVYHRFGLKDSRWTRAFSSFDHDLARLDEAGYRPITLWQYVSGTFDLPAGTSPVVITFDDSSDNQIKFTAQGQLAPDCALAHWIAFAGAHPDFPMRGVFFINPGVGGHAAFDQPRYAVDKLRLIVQLGGEVGNHTLTHANLRRQAAIAAREIALGQYYLGRDLPGYAIHSFALPFGIYPMPPSLAWEGEWHNPRPGAPAEVRWDYADVVKVGAGPAPSPLVAGFNARHLPRIQVFDPEIDHWLEYFERHPGRRFVSDGERHAPDSLSAKRGRAGS